MDYAIVFVLGGVVKVPNKIAMLATTSTHGTSDNVWNIVGIVRRARVHYFADIEIVIGIASCFGGYGTWDSIGALSHLVSIEVGGVLSLGNVGLGTLNYVGIGLYYAASAIVQNRLFAEGICSLTTDEHRVLTVAEIVGLHKGVGSAGDGSAVLRYAIEEVVE